MVLMGDPRDTGPRTGLRPVFVPQAARQETSIYKYDLEGASYLEILEGVSAGKKVLLVKKVLVHHREKIEVWYQLPNTQRFEHCDNWLPGEDSNRHHHN